MSLSWPWALLALLAIPLVIAAWWWTRRRRRRGAVRVTSIALVRASLPGRNRWRRLIPAALLLLGLAVLGVGAARPQATVRVPSSSGTIMLALDVSGSMCSTDVSPNRITAAEDAASTFIRSEAGGPRIGLVAFAGTAGVLVPPTAVSGTLLHALGGLSTSQGTAIGQGILTSLDAIAQVDPSVAPTGTRPASAHGYAHDVIVVLTDGSNNEGVDPQTAARQAAARGVRVFTIGFGTTNPAPLVCSNSQFGGYGGGFGGYGGGFGGRNPLVADYGALRQIASITGGKFYRAQNADQLKAALGTLSGTFTIIREHRDIAAWFAGLGGLLIAAALALSLWWNRTRQPSGRAADQEAAH
ncbi:MAG TPA: VWA domain-containing protein [Streptosporangiaceae bacterium]|nr:VWA domain-containing protein [Streptosporangiaceae bacterium]